MRTREEHLQWCKERALEYWNDGCLVDAVVSMTSDLDKHEETKLAAAPYLLMTGALYATNGDSIGVKRWIEGFR
jgi:hypothetical protein